MENSFDVPRTIRRIKPRQAATVAVFRKSRQLAFGVVINLSVTGACIVTASRLAPQIEVDLKLSLHRQPPMHEIGARVAWSRSGGAREKVSQGLHLHGVRFTLSSALQKSRLYALLDDERFVHVFRPSATEFDFLQDAVAGDFDEFGNQIQRIFLGEHNHNRRRQD